MTVLGMISGTSMDGIDVAAATFELRGEVLELSPLGSFSIPYGQGLRHDLASALPPASVAAEAVAKLDNEVGVAFATAAKQAIDELAPDTQLVVSHGQTLFHWVEGPRVRGSLQIGQPAWIAAETGLPVVADLRAADIAAGGQGAPLAALFDELLLSEGDANRAALNIGGIANLTIVTPGLDTIAYDIGPGNALIDAAVAHITSDREPFDRDGSRGESGEIHHDLLTQLLSDPYYSLSPPKTTGKEHFHLPYLLDAASDLGEVADDDLVATATALTAQSVADACRGHGVEEVIAAGGGVNNPTLMGMLRDRLEGIPIRPIDTLGMEASAKEAYFMAMTGFFTVHGLPGNVPSATGAARAVPLGCILAGENGFPSVEPVAVPPSRLRLRSDEQR
ncbi:MAG: anhydro-N-acetylmuramic acid kinase [Acidimicrobiia bacterium]|nr:anhydro-N-acetylmuramic acid kinase [Acidimicrobiia bacterium]